MPRTGLDGVGSYSSLLPLNGANIPAAYTAPGIGVDYHPSMRTLRQSSPAQLVRLTSLPVTLVNGVDARHLSISDRGLAYDNGLFDTVAVIDGEILNSDAHFACRLRDCQRRGITCPDVSSLAAETLTITLAFARSVVKLMTTRGNSARGYTPAVSIHLTRSVACSAWPTACSSHEGNSVTVCIANHRPCMNPQLAGLKYLNRLDHVMVNRELAETTAEAALMFDDIRTTFHIGEQARAPRNAMIAGNYHR